MLKLLSPLCTHSCTHVYSTPLSSRAMVIADEQSAHWQRRFWSVQCRGGVPCTNWFKGQMCRSGIPLPSESRQDVMRQLNTTLYRGWSNVSLMPTVIQKNNGLCMSKLNLEACETPFYCCPVHVGRLNHNPNCVFPKLSIKKSPVSGAAKRKCTGHDQDPILPNCSCL